MIIIMGLGNPGEKFKHTRHNAGFMAVDFFAKENHFPDFEFSKKYQALVSSSFAKASKDRGKENIMLVKPETFMNESGKSAKEILKNTKNYTLVVAHDDIDLPLGKFKFSQNSGAGGHKGVDSIINHLGNNNFIRLKIGIKNGEEKIKAEEVVLKKFTKEEKEILQNIIGQSAEALTYFIENGLEKTMNKYN